MESDRFLFLENRNLAEPITEKSPCGRYLRFKKIIGRGAFKDVYKGFDLVSGEEIAWNQILIEDESNLSLENQIRACSEAVLLKSLNHDNIMKCFSVWVDEKNRTVNMITELFDSGSLRQYMKKLNGVDVQTIKNCGRQILQGLHYLHSQNPRIIHRDLKCDNIFVDLEVKIGDFGLATTMQPGQDPLRALAGTPEFMAPEYYDEEYDELVDIYAFGLCLMELATGEYPYAECTNPAQVFKKVSNGIKPLALGKVGDPEVKRVIDKCLLPASERPSAFEMLKDPFFSSGMESRSNCMDSSSWVDDDDDDKLRGVVSSSSLEVAVGVDSKDRSISAEEWYLRRKAKNYSMHESILSDISALYESVTLSDVKGNGDGTGSWCYQSSIGDVSMKSNITYESSSGAVSKDLCSFT